MNRSGLLFVAALFFALLAALMIWAYVGPASIGPAVCVPRPPEVVHVGSTGTAYVLHSEGLCP